MNLDDALVRLYRRNMHVVKLGLDPMRALMGALGHPEQQLLCLHVAGTNGKGSVCAMLESVLRAQGLRTGLYTSPHLVRFNERIRVDGKVVHDRELCELMAEVEKAASGLPGMGHRDVTFFEFTTAMAFLHFARSRVQVVVLEAGMGGRLDATNVVTPVLSVITSIGLEHMEYLGSSEAAIAGEKAGIIKDGRPVVVGPMSEEAGEVIAAKARACGSRLIRAADLVGVRVKDVSLEGQTLEVESQQVSYGGIHTMLPGVHQATNAALAVASAECLAEEAGIDLSVEAVREGLECARWPARGQLLEKDPPLVVDGAHNPQGAAALAAWLKKVGRGKPVGVVAGFLADKEPAAFMASMGPAVRRIWLVQVQGDRAMPLESMAENLTLHPGVEVVESLASACDAARAWASAESGVVVVTGSLYLAAECLAASPGWVFPEPA